MDQPKRPKLELVKCERDRNLMLYPFCATSKSNRLNSIDYKSPNGKRWLKVSANNDLGIAKIWDFDILRFALWKAGLQPEETTKITGHFLNPVEFTSYECLRALGHDLGSGYKWLEKALIRLTSTTYSGNIFKDDRNTTEFTLVNIKKHEKNNGKRCVQVIFNENLLDSVKYSSRLSSIEKIKIREESGIRKRLVELVEINKGSSEEWTIWLKQLQEICAHEGELKSFKSQLKSYTLSWKLKFNKTLLREEKVQFTD